MTANSAVNRNLAGVIDNWTNLYLASIGNKDFSMEFQIGKLSEEHQKYNRNTYTHTPTHTYTHIYTHTYKHKQQERLPAAAAAKKRICHINIFKHIKEDLLCVE